MRLALLLIGLLAGTVAPACAQGVHTQAIPTGWFGDPLVEILLAVLVAWYIGGLLRMLHRQHRRWPVRKARVAAFFGGVVVIAIALLSPVDALSDRYFSVHMAQHLLLMLGAAPLFAFSDMHLVLLRALPLPERRSVGRAITGVPGVRQAAHRQAAAWLAVAAFVATLWFWHIPAAYDWALGNETVHSVEHLMLLATATAFWRVILTSGDRRLTPGMAVLLVSLVGIQGAFLSALIMFAPRSLYAGYAGNPLDDQVLAGVLMCIPASFIYLGTTLWALARMLGHESRRAR